MFKLPTPKKKNPPAVVYLTRSRMGIYCPQGLFFKELDQKLMSNLDVVKPAELEQAVKEFLETNQIVPTTFLMVVSSDVCFEKDWEGENCDSQRSEIDKYIETVPFDYIRWKSFRVGKNCRVVAINREFYETVSTAMEKMGFTLEAVVPQSIIGIDMSAGLDDNIGKQLATKIEALRASASLFESYSYTNEIKKEEELTSQKRTPVLLIVFIVMIFLLVGLVVITKPFSSTSKKKEVPTENPAEFQTKNPPAAPTSSPVVTEVGSASVSANLRVQVLNGSRVAGQADNVKKLLTTLGLKDFQTSNSPTENKGKTTVVFSKTVSPEDRNKIITVLTPTYGDIFAQEGELKQFDVVITTGSNSSNTQTPVNTQ